MCHAWFYGSSPLPSLYPAGVPDLRGEGTGSRGGQLRRDPEDVAAAIVECVEVGAGILNRSWGVPAESLTVAQRKWEEALDDERKQDPTAVAWSGIQGEIGSSAITRHPWVIWLSPVTSGVVRWAPPIWGALIG